MLKISQNENLSKYTFYGIGGPAKKIFFVNNIDEVGKIWAETIKQKIPKFILGKGSNCIFSDQGFLGHVFILTAKNFIWNKNKITVDAGIKLQDLIEISNEKNFEDMCPLSGIPGTLGGAICGNAGAMDAEISNFLESVTFIDENGNKKNFEKEKCNFGYRESIFKKKRNWFIIQATLNFSQKNINAIQKTNEIKTKRWKFLPAGKSTGCVFKNPKNETAGRLLDNLGAKNDQCGDIQISEKHANFFINKGGATQKDLIFLMKKWIKIVKEKNNILLEPEIFVCDENGKLIF